MHIIVVSRDRRRTWRFALTPRNVLLWLPLAFALGAVTATAGLVGWAVRGGSGGMSLPPELVQFWSRQVSEQRAAQ